MVMNKVILDSNFNNIAIEWNIDKSFFEECGYFILDTKTLENENSDTGGVKDKYKVLKQGSNQTGFFGFSDNPDALGFGDLFDDKRSGGIFYSKEYDKILGNSKKDRRDRGLITLAKIHSATFISADKKACKKAFHENIKIIFVQVEGAKPVDELAALTVTNKSGLHHYLMKNV